MFSKTIIFRKVNKMPVDFLSTEQKAEYGKFNNELTSEQLATYFFFDDIDKKNIYKHRGEHNKLGFAIQLGTVRFLGTLLSDIKLVPTSVVQYISQQLKIDLDKINLDKYYTSKSRRNHNNEIRQIYGYYDFAEQSQYFKFIRWLYNSAWLTSEGPNIFFEHAITQCRKQRILLPGVTVMERLISQVRERTKVRLWKKLSKLPTDEECRQLENLLTFDKKTHKILLEKLRQQCTDASLKGFLKAIKRYKEISAIKATDWNICNLPMIKIQSLARYASTCRIQTLDKMSYERRMAILVSFIIVFTVSAKDNVVDYMERYFSELFNKAKRNDNKNWLYSKKDFNNSARKLSEVCLLLLDESIPDNDIRNIIFSKIPRENLQSSIGTVDNLTTPAGQDFEYKELFRYYKSIRRFLPELLATIDFKSSKAGINTLLAWNFLRDVEKKKGKNKFVNAPTKEISTSWQKVILKDSNKINPCAYTFCTIEKILKGIKNYDIYLEKSNNYSDPRSKLITTNEWEKISSKILKILGWSKNSEESLKPLKEKIDKEYKKTIDCWEKNKSVRIDKVKGKEKIILSHLDKLEEPDSLILLKKRVNSLLPNTNLPDLLIEIAKITGFTKHFTHISQNNSRIKDFDISICAVLIANACNIGIEPLVQPGIPALEYDCLTWVERNYFRRETLIKANTVLIEYLSKLAIVKSWGNGNIASADGLRHIVPLKTIYAAPNPHYFGLGRGLTSYKLISDIFGGLNRLVITGTLRDSLYLLELVLGNKHH
jgi:TnpA family transposase